MHVIAIPLIRRGKFHVAKELPVGKQLLSECDGGGLIRPNATPTRKSRCLVGVFCSLSHALIWRSGTHSET